MPLAISPHFTTEHFREPLSIEDKISLFSDRVRGWQLDIAEYLESHPHAGFAILSIVSSYFEMFAKYEAGYTLETASKKYFKEGLKSVLGPHTQPTGSIPDRALSLLYEEVRCGMYHAGITGPRVRLSGSTAAAIVLQGEAVTVNPHQLVMILQDHFSRYVSQLLDPANDQRRRNFEARFDAAHVGKHLGTPMG